MRTFAFNAAPIRNYAFCAGKLWNEREGEKRETWNATGLLALHTTFQAFPLLSSSLTRSFPFPLILARRRELFMHDVLRVNESLKSGKRKRKRRKRDGRRKGDKEPSSFAVVNLNKIWAHSTCFFFLLCFSFPPFFVRFSFFNPFFFFFYPFPLLLSILFVSISSHRFPRSWIYFHRTDKTQHRDTELWHLSNTSVFPLIYLLSVLSFLLFFF